MSARKAFGGKPNKLPKPFCAHGKPPSALNDFLATYDTDQSQVVLTWDLPPKKPPKDLTIYRGKRNGPCPTANGKDSNVEFTERAADGRAKDFVSGGGTFCYRAVGRNEYNRPGESAKATVEIVGNGPAADFDYYQTGATEVKFTDYSDDPEGDIDSWDWDFGDGSGSSYAAQSHPHLPIHRFVPGDPHGHRPGRQFRLRDEERPGRGRRTADSGLLLRADDRNHGRVHGLLVRRRRRIVSWNWDFGDGSAGSTEQNPTHVFPDYGTYDVTLAVTDDDGNVVETTMEIDVLELGAPFAEFDYYQSDTGEPVEFYDYSYDEDGEIVSWLWDFGDGSADSTEQFPIHPFAAPGEYEVTLTVTDNDGKSVERDLHGLRRLNP